MAAISRATATWTGDLTSGSGTVTPESATYGGMPIAWASRAERMQGKTSPDELIAAAHAAFYNMSFSNGLAKAGHTAASQVTTVDVDYALGTGITTITVRR